MRPELQHIEQIERYLKGLMTSEERRDMENRLLSDVTLQEELRLQQWVMQGIEQAGWREELNAIHNSIPAYSEVDAERGNWYGFLMLGLLTAFISAYLYVTPSVKPVLNTDSVKVSVVINLPSVTAQNDTLTVQTPVVLQDDSVFWKPELEQRIFQLVPAKDNAPAEQIPAVHFYPVYEKYEEEYYTQWYKVKQFPMEAGARMVILPVTSLDYDFHFQKEADALLDYKFNQLLDEKYEKTFVATIPFRYRMEGAIMYNEKADLINLYMKNTNLLLWQVDSMAAELLKEKAAVQCDKREFWLKGYEYFRWLSSLRQGELLYTPCVERNYRKGGVYKAVEQDKEERYFISCGLTPEEARGVFDYFKNMYEIRSRFRVAMKDDHDLRYHYEAQGYEVNMELPVCK